MRTATPNLFADSGEGARAMNRLFKIAGAVVATAALVLGTTVPYGGSEALRPTDAEAAAAAARKTAKTRNARRRTIRV